MARPFTPTPDIVYVETIEQLPLAQFAALPDHPAQRQTMIHAVDLMRSGVLEEPLDQHREVKIILIGDPDNEVTIDKMLELYRADRDTALRLYAAKEDGHTRDYIYRSFDIPVPVDLRATVYAARDLAAATRSYNAVDCLAAVKGKRDMMQTTVHIAQIAPVSDWLKRASDLSGALNTAQRVCCGGGNFKFETIRRVLINQQNPNAIDMMLHEALPHLATTLYFKSAIEVLDSLQPIGAVMPLGSAFVAGYLSILQRDPEQGQAFIEALQTESGGYLDAQMDAFYCIKKVWDRVHDKREVAKTTPAQRSNKILACVLNAYEAWVRSPPGNFKAGLFPTGPRVIARFNPVLLGPVTRAARTDPTTGNRRPSDRDQQGDDDQPSA